MDRKRLLNQYLHNATQTMGRKRYSFSDSFTRSDGAIGGGWTGGTWTIASGVALNTPNLGSEKVANANFETGDPPSSWGGGSANTQLDGVADERTGGSGAQSLDVLRLAASWEQASQTVVVTYDTWFQLSAWVKNVFGTSANINRVSGPVGCSVSSSSGSWTWIVGTGRSHTTNGILYAGPGNNTINHNSRTDDISVKSLTLTELFATQPACGYASVTANVILTVNPAYGQAGHVLNLDSIAAPANFVIAYLDTNGGVARLDKCVSGSYTNVISGAVTFGATKNLKLRKSGNSYSLYYGAPGSETQVGTTQTITGMTGTIHGLFSTYSTARFDTYSIAKT